jgi:hypothetical protein
MDGEQLQKAPPVREWNITVLDLFQYFGLWKEKQSSTGKLFVPGTHLYWHVIEWLDMILVSKLPVRFSCLDF